MQNTEAGKLKEIRKWRWCGCVVIPVILAALVWIPYAYHDFLLVKLDLSYSSLSHPVRNTLIEHHKTVGLLIGNGDHCDYFVGELRSYSGKKQDVHNYYRGKTIWNPINKQWQEVEIAFIDNGKPTSALKANIHMPSPVFDLAEKYKTKCKNSKLYVVYVLDVGHDVWFDVRGM